MNVLIYFPKINRSYGGVYQYTYALLKTLCKDNENKYYLLTEKNEEIDNLIRYNKNLQWINPAEAIDSIWVNRGIRILKFGLRILDSIGLNIQVNCLSSLDKLCKRYSIDILHSPVQTIPKVFVPKIVTLHDVQELHFPQFFTSGQRMWRAINYKISIDNADAVIVSYEHIRQDIIQFFDKPHENVHVVLMEMGNLWFDKFQEEFEIVKFHGSNARDSYILYPAATWPHKNHIGLLIALKILKDRGFKIKLICTGHLTSHYENIQATIKEFELEEEVSFLGIVPDSVLFGLYRKALGVVVPTLYEAGSFPLMEAILMQKPVICSNVTSLPETIGNLQYTFNPNDFNSIAEKIEMLVTSEEFRSENISNSKLQSQRLLSTGALLKLKNIYSRIATS